MYESHEYHTHLGAEKAHLICCIVFECVWSCVDVVKTVHCKNDCLSDLPKTFSVNATLCVLCPDICLVDYIKPHTLQSLHVNIFMQIKGIFSLFWHPFTSIMKCRVSFGYMKTLAKVISIKRNLDIATCCQMI